MEAHAAMTDEFEDWYQREIDSGLPEGDGRASVRLRCDYLLEQIRDQEKRAEEVAQFTARRIQMVQDHSQGELDAIKRRIEWLHSRLRMHIPPTGEGMEREFGKKSLSLPNGTIGYRASPPSLRIVDMPKAVAWAKGAGLQVEVTEKVGVVALKVALGLTGEIPDGTEYAEGSEGFYVKSAKVED